MNIREYIDNDLTFLQDSLVKLNNYIAATDPLKRIYTSDDFKKIYTEDVLDRVHKQNGIIYICIIEGIPVGFIAGIIEKPSPVERTCSIAATDGRIIELFLEEKFRGTNIAQALMQKMEEFFKRAGCNLVWIDVFNYNEIAKKFYSKCGYETRNIEICKPI